MITVGWLPGGMNLLFVQVFGTNGRIRPDFGLMVHNLSVWGADGISTSRGWTRLETKTPESFMRMNLWSLDTLESWEKAGGPSPAPLPNASHR